MNQNLSQELEAIQKGCGIAPLPKRAFLRARGADSTRWLNGMVTNSVTALQPGEGAYSFLLNAQGRIQGDCTVYREASANESASYLLSTTAAQVDVIEPWLDRYIIMDDVALTRALEDEASLLLLGPRAPSVLQALGLPTPDPLRLLLAETTEGSVRLFTPAPSSSVSTFISKVELRGAPAVIAQLHQSIVENGCLEMSPETLEPQRILEGTPLFGKDIRDRDLPQETGQAQALHFAKGCYLGQEIVERIRSRGQVHRILTRFELSGSLPEPVPAPLTVGDGDNAKAAGELTSAAQVPSAEGERRCVALGYVRREFLASNSVLNYTGGTAVPLTRP